MGEDSLDKTFLQMDATFLSHPFISVSAFFFFFPPDPLSFCSPLLTDNGSIRGRNEIFETIFSKDIISFFFFFFVIAS